MKMMLVCAHMNFTIKRLITVLKLKEIALQTTNPDGQDVKVPAVLLHCTRVRATESGLIRLELLQKEGQPPGPEALLLPPLLILWAVETEEGQGLPFGFSG